MRPRHTFHLLSTAFTLAIAACKKEPLEQPPPPLPPSTTPSAVPEAMTTTTIRQTPTERRYGQRCGGDLVPGLTPAQAVDYLELRLDYYPEKTKHEIVIAGSKGEACSQARDKATCQKELEVAKAENGGQYLVYVRGADVGTIHGKATGEFLAPIDSAEEAALTLVQTLAENTSTAAILPSCAAKDYRQTPEGWETTQTVAYQCDEKLITTYLVTRDGESKRLSEKRTPKTPGCQPAGKGRRPEGFALDPRADRSSRGGHAGVAASESEARGGGRGSAYRHHHRARRALRGIAASHHGRRSPWARARRHGARERGRGLRVRDLGRAPRDVPGGPCARRRRSRSDEDHRSRRDAARGARMGRRSVRRSSPLVRRSPPRERSEGGGVRASRRDARRRAERGAPSRHRSSLGERGTAPI